MANNPQSTGMLPHMISHVGPPNPIPSMTMQYRPAIPPPSQTFPVHSQQFQPGGPVNMGRPPPPQYAPAGTPLPPPPPPPRSSLAGHALAQGLPSQQTDVPPNRPMIPAPAQSHISSSFMPSFGGPINPNMPYNLSSGGQQQVNVVSAVQHPAMPLTDAPNFSAGGQPWIPHPSQKIQPVLPTQPFGEQNAAGPSWFSTMASTAKPVTPLKPHGEQNPGPQHWIPSGNQNVHSGTPVQTEEQSSGVLKEKSVKPDAAKTRRSEWIEHTSREGNKYYYSKRTGISSWEKPLELMTPIERADATTDWREVTTRDGIRFYYNKVTNTSKWVLPEEVKLARERASVLSYEGASTMKDVTSCFTPAVSVSGAESLTPNASNLPSLVTQEMAPSPHLASSAANLETVVVPGSSSMQEEPAEKKSDNTGKHTPVEIASSMAVSDIPVPVAVTTAMTPPLRTSTTPPQDAAAGSAVKSSTGGAEETTKSVGNPGYGDIRTPEGGISSAEGKKEAKKAFKALLESVNVGSDWNWDQAMRLIINDRRYGALRTLGERKQAFNEFLGQKKKREAEEKRARQRKAREDFKNMLQESKDLTPSTRWSKAVAMFEKDTRFLAVERARDREDLFEDYMEELVRKERAKAMEEHKRHRVEYLEFLKSCDFIKASSQWRKVQHRLEADERCARLEKIERLEIFQEYVRDLELEEEEQRKLRMEEQRKTERKNRDEFRKLMEEHVASGILSANSHWRDYCMKVKDEPPYLAVSSNTSGSTAKDLFDDVIDDLEKKYFDDKEKVEEAMKIEKISLSSMWAFEDFKGALAREIDSKSVSDVNLKFIFDELMIIVKEREEKESKKRKRLTEDVYEFLFNSKEVTSSSKWEDCKPLVEERFIGEDSFFKEIFDTVILDLKEKAKEKERKRKEEKAKKEKERKDKERREKDKDRRRGYGRRKNKNRHKIDETDSNGSESEPHSMEGSKRSRDRSKKFKKRPLTSYDDSSFDDDEKDHSFSRYRRQATESKRPKQTWWSGDADFEGQSKRHRKSYYYHDHEERHNANENEDGEVR
ncbi:pre-mRNA-processing protein 40A-like isoform X2 [Andrographis paniculata]|uniref:pre-mRNA-processing protein 40A-like isoform X2 n=1 Tax=Andrographis paniculata TaxID=175694 RepID=UPI0021E83CBA|nr:pre-mRNA-processing protein 40A-like isoform X2 [Andrographis paniculata]